MTDCLLSMLGTGNQSIDLESLVELSYATGLGSTELVSLSISSLDIIIY